MRSRSRVLDLALFALLVAIPAAAAEEPAADPQPVFKPGIPDLKMADVRDHKYLWRELDELQTWERSNRLTVAEFRSKAIEKTAHYLGFSGAEAEAFTATATTAVADLRAAFAEMRQAGSEDGQARFDASLESAVARVSSTFKPAPRHKLFAPDCKKWLMRLTFGPKASKEAAEAKKAPSPGASGSDSPAATP